MLEEPRCAAHLLRHTDQVSQQSVLHPLAGSVILCRVSLSEKARLGCKLATVKDAWWTLCPVIFLLSFGSLIFFFFFCRQSVNTRKYLCISLSLGAIHYTMLCYLIITINRTSLFCSHMSQLSTPPSSYFYHFWFFMELSEILSLRWLLGGIKVTRVHLPES